MARHDHNTRCSGARDVAPLAAVIGVLGLLFGYLCTAAGMSPLAAVAMSATTFSGSAQFAAVLLLQDRGTALGAVLAGALIASRHFAMGAAVARGLPASLWRRAFVAQLTVDESLAVAYHSDGSFSAARLLGAGLVIYAVHVSTTAIGALSHGLVGDPSRWGLDAALPALFVLLLWPRLGDREERLTATLAGGIALALIPWVPRGLGIVAAACIAFVPVERMEGASR
jgi:predicted branched-subunit amino acid permease